MLIPTDENINIYYNTVTLSTLRALINTSEIYDESHKKCIIKKKENRRNESDHAWMPHGYIQIKLKYD